MQLRSNKWLWKKTVISYEGAFLERKNENTTEVCIFLLIKNDQIRVSFIHKPGWLDLLDRTFWTPICLPRFKSEAFLPQVSMRAFFADVRRHKPACCRCSPCVRAQPATLLRLFLPFLSLNSAAVTAPRMRASSRSSSSSSTERTHRPDNPPPAHQHRRQTQAER